MSFSTRTMTAQDWLDLAKEFGRAYFTPDEFKEPARMGFEFIRWLFGVRHKAGVKMKITSSYRAPWYNKLIKGAKKSAHMDEPICDAVDIAPENSYARHKIIFTSYELGCRRHGIYKNGSIHLDRTEDRRPADVLWTVVNA
jgi:uncharacterized protein YcbK (DUF882 family)